MFVVFSGHQVSFYTTVGGDGDVLLKDWSGELIVGASETRVQV